jgi:hypothetical protein
MEFKLATSSSAHQKTISEIERTLETVSGHKLQLDTHKLCPTQFYVAHLQPKDLNIRINSHLTLRPRTLLLTKYSKDAP